MSANAASIIRMLLAIQTRDLRPTPFHSPVTRPPMLELTTMPPTNSPQPTEGPSLPSISVAVDTPHNATLPEYITAINATTSQYHHSLRYSSNVCFFESK